MGGVPRRETRPRAPELRGASMQFARAGLSSVAAPGTGALRFRRIALYVRWSRFLPLPTFLMPLRLSLPLSLGVLASSSRAACAAAKRATGTRNGEQLT